MRNAIYLAMQSLRWHRGRAVTIVLCLAMTMWLPLTVRLLLNEFRTEISARAAATPLVIGAKGSRIDLALHALYFQTLPPSTIPNGELTLIQDSDLATAIPVYSRYQTQGRGGQSGAAIVGTSLEYFEFRELTVASGQMLSVLGDCVVGARVAQRLKLQPGDSILSAPRNAFNLAGDYPLRMRVAGILAESYSPDDDVVFTDTRTVWIIDGIGHGHQDLTSTEDQTVLLDRQADRVTASAAVLPFTEITEANLDSFHFHGDPATFPLTAIIAVPNSEKSRVLLLGRYASAEKQGQCLKPPEVVNELLHLVFRIEQLVWVSSIIATIVTSLLLALVLMLSLRLRAAEIQTMFRLGCRRSRIVLLLSAEVLILLTSSAALAVCCAWIGQQFAADFLRQFLF